MTDAYDLVVLGGGSGGLTAARFAAALGMRVAIVEKRRMGGDCTWTGCVPSKALLRAARVAQEVRDAGRYGIRATAPEADMAAVRAYVRAAIDRVYRHETPEQLEREGVAVLPGTARFEDPHTVAVGDRIVRSRAFLISTGAGPFVPPVPGLDRVPFVTYEQIFDADSLPAAFVVMGGGPIGLEMAQAYRRLGSDVTIVTDRLLPREDAEACSILQAALQREGVRILWGLAVSVHAEGETIVVRTDRGDARGDRLLVAVGRRPAVEGLGLERAGVRHSRAGIPVDTRLRSNVRHVYAAGDVTGGPQFTHLAAWQGFQAARNALLPGHRSGLASLVPRVTFTDPEIAHVGANEAEARAAHGGAVRVERWPLARTDRAVREGDEHGFFRFVTRADGTLLGATVVARHAGDVIGELGLAIARRLKMADLAGVIHAYPTYSTAVQQLASTAALDAFFAGAPGRVVRALARIVRAV